MFLFISQENGSTEVGYPAPNFALTNVQTGSSFGLSDFKGKIVVIEFMATWCSHCSDQVSELKKVRSQFSNDSLIIVSISSDPGYDTDSKLIQFAASEGIDWYLARDTANVTQAYNVSNIPTTFLVDRAGKVAAFFIGFVSA